MKADAQQAVSVDGRFEESKPEVVVKADVEVDCSRATQLFKSEEDF